MKKILFIIVALLISLNVSCQVYKYQTTAFSYKSVDNNGYWTDWSEWESSSMLIVLNTNNNRIDIYSQTPQHYDIVNYKGTEYDDQGGSTYTLECVDEEGSRCNVRTRAQSDGQLQLYVDYSDMCWVYNISRKD